MAIKICFATRKGGNSKTSGSLELYNYLKTFKKKETGENYKVLFLDTDPQCSSTKIFNARIEGVPTLYDIFFDNYKASECIQKTPYGDIIASDDNLKHADSSIKPSPKMYRYIKNALKEVEDEYDFIIIDTMPYTGLILGNVLNCVNYVICPIMCDLFSIQGLMDFYEILQEYKEDNETLELLGLLITRYKGRQTLTKDIEDNLLPTYAEKMHTRIFKTRIRECVKLPESQALRIPLREHSPMSTVAQDYKEFTNELLNILKEKGEI